MKLTRDLKKTVEELQASQKLEREEKNKEWKADKNLQLKIAHREGISAIQKEIINKINEVTTSNYESFKVILREIPQNIIDAARDEIIGRCMIRKSDWDYLLKRKKLVNKKVHKSLGMNSEQIIEYYPDIWKPGLKKTTYIMKHYFKIAEQIESISLGNPRSEGFTSHT
ncbi:unnamed protein product [Blepharisma stoltei]|uniref:Uncharacterized protein n=1 Tax=Blepharisma stoltei TaxID=1481888 RepID=A0AAU9J4K1_9CILI|nr:unnamed protein product [Blepharisma stoltei]